MVSSPKGFFGSLYDLSFHTFITPRIIQVVYVVVLVCVAISALGFLASGFAPSIYGGGPSPFGILLHIVGAAIWFVVGSIFARVYLELVMAIFRIAENTDPRRVP